VANPAISVPRALQDDSFRSQRSSLYEVVLDESVLVVKISQERIKKLGKIVGQIRGGGSHFVIMG
jgi:predicted AAA+ superfamily ATPase